jgi:uncharacterized protein with NAD-binding domain and iron-sulfur cluster
MPVEVIVLGGGIAGLSAAHELIERGFNVEVYEALSIPGGKARSMGVRGSAALGPNGMRKELPGEHGFRFFPRFYQHVTDTMARIPLPGNRSVADNLVDTTRIQLCRFDRRPIEMPTRCPRNWGDVRVVLDDAGRLYGGDFGLSHEEIAFFVSRVWQIITSCHERRINEYEKIPWWKFIDAESRSWDYKKLLGHGITRSLVAAKADRASTKTIGDIFVQLIFDIATPGSSSDRVLNGPTNDVWINPWLDYLTKKGVRYHTGSKVKSVEYGDGRIRAITVEQSGTTTRVEGDYFVFALPIEDIIPLLTPELIAAEPQLAHLSTLDDATEWMTGLQIYLTEDVKLAHGHTIYVDSPWALTSISQPQFWRGIDLSEYGDGKVKGIISVDISDWDAKGLNGKSAKECTPDEVKAEVWEQLKRSVNYGDHITLKDEHLHAWALDPSVKLSATEEDLNEEPLLVNLVNTWALRPEATTRIPNMFLASDYVRTYTDLATMESANEAARRAVNGIIKASGSSAPACTLWPLHEPEIFAPWRELDKVRYEQGLPWDDTWVVLGLSAQRLTDKLISLWDTLPIPSEHITAPSGSDIATDAMMFVQRAVQLFAARAAEAEAMGVVGGMRARSASEAQPNVKTDEHSRARSGKVRIVT